MMSLLEILCLSDHEREKRIFPMISCVHLKTAQIGARQDGSCTKSLVLEILSRRCLLARPAKEVFGTVLGATSLESTVLGFG